MRIRDRLYAVERGGTSSCVLHITKGGVYGSWQVKLVEIRLLKSGPW